MFLWDQPLLIKTMEKGRILKLTSKLGGLWVFGTCFSFQQNVKNVEKITDV